MKGNYIHHIQEEEEANNTNDMFAKLHYHHQHHHHQLSLERQASEEDESRSSGGGGGVGTTTNKIKKGEQGNSGGGGDGATIEVVRRPRGRPPGSKNKPKPPVFITRDTECAMRPHVLQVPGGLDIIDAIDRFARRRNIGLCVLTGSGTVANVSLRQPSTTPGATVTFHGRFDILSISATFLPPSSSSSSSLPSPATNSFTISLAGPQGQIVGGSVVGSLLAAGTVSIVAASFTSPSYHRLPIEEEDPNSLSGNNNPGNHPPPSAPVSGEENHPPTAESCGMSIYSCHLPSDVIWAPTARQAPPPPF